MASGHDGSQHLWKTPTKKVTKKLPKRCFVCGKDLVKYKHYYRMQKTTKGFGNQDKEHSISCVCKVLLVPVVDHGTSYVCHPCCKKAEKIVANTGGQVLTEISRIEFREMYRRTKAETWTYEEDDSIGDRMKRMSSSPHGKRIKKRISLSSGDSRATSLFGTSASEEFDLPFLPDDPSNKENSDPTPSNSKVATGLSAMPAEEVSEAVTTESSKPPVPTSSFANNSSELQSHGSTVSEQATKVVITVYYPKSKPSRKELDSTWSPVGKAMCAGKTTSAIRQVLQMPEARELAINEVAKIVKSESESICKRPNLKAGESMSQFRNSNPSALDKWSYEQQRKELDMKAPTLLTMLEAAAVNKQNTDRNAMKTEDSLVPGIMTSAGILFYCRSQEMNAHAALTGLQLKRGGTDKAGIQRLHARKLTVSYGTVKTKQEQYCADYDKNVKEWAKQVEGDSKKKKELEDFVKVTEDAVNVACGSWAHQIAAKAHEHAIRCLEEHTRSSHPSYRIVGDNVDHKVKPRHMTTENKTSDLHHFQLFAVKNRVSSMHLPDDGPIVEHDKLDIGDLLPTVKDNQILRHTWCVLAGRIISKYLPELKWIEKHLPTLSHSHMKEAKSKSEIVHLGVIPENENTKDGIHKIMKHMHTYVPGHNEQKPIPVISGGDLLTCEREAKTMEDQRDGMTANDKLDGLIPTIEDFHTLANFYQVIWKELYNSLSASDVGTLMYCRNNLGANNVTKDPMKDINAARDFLDKWTEALILTAAMDFFGMNQPSSEPTKNTFDLIQHHNRDFYVIDVLGQFIDKYAIVSDGEFISTQTNDLKCPFCPNKYKQLVSLQKHFNKTHGRVSIDEVLQEEDSHEEANDTSDSTFNYCRNALCLCLLAYDFTDARQIADGERIVRLHKFLMLHFKATNKYKYAKHALRHVAMANYLLSPRLAHDLTWNRFINNLGKSSSNIEMDRCIEFINRVYKGNVRGFKGKITEASIKRVGRSAQRIENMLLNVDKQSGTKSRAGTHKPAAHEKDVLRLVEQLHGEKVFEEREKRHLFFFPDFPRTLLGKLDIDDLFEWMTDAVDELTSKRCFRRLGDSNI